MMNQRTQPLRMMPSWSRSLMVSGLSLASVLGILGGTLQAQTSVESGDATAPIESAPILSEPQMAPIEPAPFVPDPAPIESVAPANEAYIDSTDYGIGATERTSPVAASPEMPQIRLPNALESVQAGPISIATESLGVGTTASLKDFYQRTFRPPGRLGNGNIQLVFPLSLPAPITSAFGWRVHPLFGATRLHSGTDLGAPMGTPVLAAYAGQVAVADFLGGYGLAVALNHNKGTQQSLYGHLSEIFVKQGELVKQGEVIGRVGSTGNSTGPHLHFEFRQLTPEGWVALDSGDQLEYALASLVKALDISQKGIAAASDLKISYRGLAGVSGEIDWQKAKIKNAPNQLSSTVPSSTSLQSIARDEQ
ncbi:M23 family metallopeptidase [Phormidium sp. CLA17]|uniref:M23 family metallopeptidase n=1 Tax=Leptolyngbya sp. Cla-17 TaxID=2803751 RepID=UPI001491E4D2|nr:M23 family metallopeptidase [Leptolyngbya sp. Cla-17]MBM0742090.1 M23 family metallopeptidase [Leptolyngbya sp. Cla-17]